MRVGRVEVTGGFFLLAAWLNYLDREFLVPLTMLACALHELGHYTAIRLLGEDVRLIRLTAVGAEMVIAHPLGYWQEGLAALAGPGTNLLLALIFCTREWGAAFAGLNLLLACFNMVPVGRLDGGRALNCAISLILSPDLANEIGRCLDLICTGLLLSMGVFLAGAGGNITLLLVAVWLLAVFFSQNLRQRNRNRACHRGRKQVK